MLINFSSSFYKFILILFAIELCLIPIFSLSWKLYWLITALNHIFSIIVVIKYVQKISFQRYSSFSLLKFSNNQRIVFVCNFNIQYRYCIGCFSISLTFLSKGNFQDIPVSQPDTDLFLFSIFEWLDTLLSWLFLKLSYNSFPFFFICSD